MHACAHACMHACTHTHTHTHTRTRTHSRTRTRAHPHPRTHAHAHTHTHTCRHTPGYERLDAAFLNCTLPTSLSCLPGWSVGPWLISTAHGRKRFDLFKVRQKTHGRNSHDLKKLTKEKKLCKNKMGPQKWINTLANTLANTPANTPAKFTSFCVRRGNERSHCSR